MKLRLAPVMWWLPSLALVVSCSVYDSSLLGTSGSGGGVGGQGLGGTAGSGMSSSSGSTSPSTGGGGTGGVSGCSAPGDCPGTDTECKKRSCDAHICGFDFTDSGIAIAAQTTGDCSTAVCDGKGGIIQKADDTDLPDDMKECTDDTCASGKAVFTPKDSGVSCTEGTAGQVCDGSGHCVECVDGTQCPTSHVCKADNTCEGASCGDGMQNGDETDKDCGGSCPTKCAFNQHCKLGTDCKGGTCTGLVCVATCTDGVMNGGESDIDCGGSGACPRCDIGQSCTVPSDCTVNACTGTKCACAGNGMPNDLLISEIQSRGAGGGSDEFVEIYNPSAADFVMDANWTIEIRSSTSPSYSVKAFGSGGTVPAQGYYLLGGSAYVGPPAADFTALPGIKDAASVVLRHAGVVIDAVCFSYNQTSHDAIANGSGYVCEGTLVSNLPHNDLTTGQSNSNVSIQRKPHSPLGSCIDTGDSAADFDSGVASTPKM